MKCDFETAVKRGCCGEMKAPEKRNLVRALLEKGPYIDAEILDAYKNIANCDKLVYECRQIGKSVPEEHSYAAKVITEADVQLIIQYSKACEMLADKLKTKDMIEKCFSLLDEGIEKGILTARYLIGKPIFQTAHEFNCCEREVRKKTDKALDKIAKIVLCDGK